VWDPETYLAFADERTRPFADLMAQIPATDPAEVVDLGCGPGTMTGALARRWPAARVVGVDSSPQMVAAAMQVPGIEVARTDLREWRPSRPVDILVSNATLQWVPDHLELLPTLASFLAPGGWLAFQVPGNFGEPSHVLLREQAAAPAWRGRLDVEWPDSAEPAAYSSALLGLGLHAQVWETTYLHVLSGDDAVLRWISGSGLRPVLAQLAPDDRSRFVEEYGAALNQAYPPGPHGTVLPYRRIFAVARRD
jgi:trans-aconitate 2-methyltransferase